jgi:hypothetical protein
MAVMAVMAVIMVITITDIIEEAMADMGWGWDWVQPFWAMAWAVTSAAGLVIMDTLDTLPAMGTGPGMGADMDMELAMGMRLLLQCPLRHRLCIFSGKRSCKSSPRPSQRIIGTIAVIPRVIIPTSKIALAAGCK